VIKPLLDVIVLAQELLRFLHYAAVLQSATRRRQIPPLLLSAASLCVAM
jgi:hypothetical protein